MNHEPETTEAILQTITRLLAGANEMAEVHKTVYPSRVYWSLLASADATPKLVGRNGTHVKAIAHLVRGFVNSGESPFKFALLDPEPGPASNSPSREVNPTYEPSDLIEFVEAVILALGVGEYCVDTEPRGKTTEGGAAHELQIWVRSQADYDLLTVPRKGTDMTNVAALGVICRAAANFAGGRVNVEVKRA